MVNWNTSAINEMVAQWTNNHATRLDGIVRTRADFPTEVAWASAENLTAAVVSGVEGVIREYGTAEVQPEPWGIPAIMEAAR